MKRGIKTFLFTIVFLSLTNHLYSEAYIIDSLSSALAFAFSNEKSLAYEKENARLLLKNSYFSLDAFLPSLSFSMNDSESRVKNTKDSQTLSCNFSVEQPLFNGGRSLFALQKNISDAKANLLLLDEKENAFSLKVIKNFLSCLVQKKQLEAANACLQTAEEELSFVKAEWERGLCLEEDYLSCKISVMQIKAEAEKNLNEWKKKVRSFKMLSSVSEEVEIDFSCKDNFEDFCFFLEDSLSLLWSKFLLKNSRLKLSQNELEWKRKNLFFQNFIWLPKITAGASLVFQGSALPLVQPEYSFFINLSFPDMTLIKPSTSASFSGNKGQFSKANIGFGGITSFSPAYAIGKESARLSLYQSESALEEEKRALKEELLSALYEHDDCVRNVKITEERLSLLTQKIEVDKVRVKNGSMKRINYLEDEIERLKVENELIFLKGQCASTVYELDILIGGDLGEVYNSIRH